MTAGQRITTFIFSESLGNLACGVELSNARLQIVHLCGLMGAYECFVLIIYPFLQLPSATCFNRYCGSNVFHVLHVLDG